MIGIAKVLEGNRSVLDDLKHHSKVVGMKQTMKAVEADRVQTVYIANDADERLVSKITDRCRIKGIKVIEVESMKISRFEDILAWQKAKTLTKEIYLKFSDSKDYSF